MRTTLVVVLLGLVTTHVAAVGTGGPPSWSHTRPLTSSAARLVAEAAELSPTVRAELEALERTDVVVYVTDSLYVPESAPQAYLRFVSQAGGRRYLLVHLERFRTSPSDRIAWLAHELQHALEIAAAPSVQDEAGLTRLYRHIGWQSGTRQFETNAAQATGKRVRSQLLGTSH